jgi:hypothetical protein
MQVEESLQMCYRCFDNTVFARKKAAPPDIGLPRIVIILKGKIFFELKNEFFIADFLSFY